MTIKTGGTIPGYQFPAIGAWSQDNIIVFFQMEGVSIVGGGRFRIGRDLLWFDWFGF